VQPKVYTSDDHHIRDEHIDPDALFVLKRLVEAGYEAYLVGGGVRDLLLHRRPKDFDISTSARPEEVRQLFRRCFLVGRRFRLAHVRFGEKVIEVATFRAGDPDEATLIVHDNVWGGAESDALRRDFTINGLYYEAESRQIIDYCGGFHDLNAGLLRVIGNPETRFCQDPVRMLRLLKFRARFGFEIEEKALEALHRCYREIIKSAPARLLEEMLRMLESGAAEPFIQLMQTHHLLALLFPVISECLREEMGAQIYQLLGSADHLIKEGYTLSRAALVSALLFPMVQNLIQKEFKESPHPPNLGQILAITEDVIEGSLVQAFSHFPRRLRGEVAFILNTQFRFTPLNKRKSRSQRLASHPDLPLAVELLRIRATLDPQLEETCAGWEEAAAALPPSAPIERTANRRRRRRPRAI
jgi:poly(A) polymerase